VLVRTPCETSEITTILPGYESFLPWLIDRALIRPVVVQGDTIISTDLLLELLMDQLLQGAEGFSLSNH
jgi:hypothetical protein